jgi:hypothetical protein
MKKIITIITVGLALSAFTIARQVKNHTDDIFRLLNIPKAEGTQYIRENFIYASIATPYSFNPKHIAGGNRAALVRQLGAFMKDYVQSSEMKEAWMEYRASMAPPDLKAYEAVTTLSPEQEQEIERQRKEFDREYPEDPRLLVKTRLQEFLDLTADIDFNARLVNRNGRMVFENPDYESRDANWKKCFRAGKETIAAARDFAQQWLKEIK